MSIERFDPSALDDTAELNLTTKNRASLHVQLLRSHIVQSCLNCEHWRMNMCEKFDTVPPPRVIVYSCPEWMADIPF